MTTQSPRSLAAAPFSSALVARRPRSPATATRRPIAPTGAGGDTGPPPSARSATASVNEGRRRHRRPAPTAAVHLLAVSAPTSARRRPAAVAPPAISGGTLRILADGHTAVAADPDRDRVYIVDLDDQAVRATITLNAG